MFGAGMFKVPFNYEMPEYDYGRPWIERSWMQRNMFPGEFDIGLHADFSWQKKLLVTASVINGRTIGEPDFAVVPDFNRGKDATLRVNYNFGPIELGVSGYFGRGQVVDAGKLRFKQFDRWAVGGETQFHHAFARSVGQTRVYGEIVVAQNMDRGTIALSNLPTIPDDLSANVVNKREMGALVRIEQELGRVFMLGFRWDWYTPDYGVAKNGRHTFAGLFAVNMGHGLRTLIEVDHAMDNVHGSGPAPSVRVVDTMLCTLQGRL
jgi:hypothetical protein